MWPIDVDAESYSSFISLPERERSHVTTERERERERE